MHHQELHIILQRFQRLAPKPQIYIQVLQKNEL